MKFRTSAATKEWSGMMTGLAGIALIYGGIGAGLAGNRHALDIALVGTIVTAASSVPLSIAKEQERQELQARIRGMRIDRGML
jgi:predicted lipid-binding transport protein (Tim44 family)